jgi:hypothetical protein
LVPAAASALNWDIVGAMLTVKESMLTDGTVAEPVADPDAAAGDELDEDEQPAATRARAPARASQPSLGKPRNLPSLPSLLLLTRIPHTLSPECIRISRPGYRCSSGIPTEGG